MIGAAALLLVVAVIGAIIVGVVGVVGVVALARRASHADHPAGSPEGHVVRQLFQYLLLLVLLVVSAVGTAGLLGALFARGTTFPATDTTIARSVAFTVVGLPLLLGLAWMTRRLQAADPAEERSIPWVAYLSVASIVSLTVALVALHATVAGAVGLRPLDPMDAANALVWCGAWALHWWLCRRQADQRTLQPLHLAGSLLGLVLGLIGLGTVLSGTLEHWLGLADGPVLVGRDDAIVAGAVTFGLAGAVWVRSWVFAALRSAHNVLWHLYVLLVGVAAGLVVTLTAASIAMDRLLVWLLGNPRTDDAHRYFASMPAALAAAMVGLLTLTYHQAVLRAVGHEDRTEVERLRDYLLAAIGLGTLCAGSTIVAVALVEAAVDPSLVSGGTAANTLIAALTLLAVGAPVWQLFWRRGQRAAAAGSEEVGSLTRRLYLFLLLGLTSVATVGALIAGAWVLVDRILQNEGTAATVRSIRYPIGILATAAVAAAYHWAVYRTDRARHPKAPRPTASFVLLLGVADADTAIAVGRRLGSTAWTWERRDVPLQVWPEDQLVAAVRACGAPETVVIADAGRLHAIPISRRPATGSADGARRAGPGPTGSPRTGGRRSRRRTGWSG